MHVTLISCVNRQPPHSAFFNRLCADFQLFCRSCYYIAVFVIDRQLNSRYTYHFAFSEISFAAAYADENAHCRL